MIANLCLSKSLCFSQKQRPIYKYLIIIFFVFSAGIAPITTPLPTISTRSTESTRTKVWTIGPGGDGGNGRREVVVKEPLSTGVIIGIVLALIVFAILVSAAIWMYMKKTKSGLHSTGRDRLDNRQNYIVEVEMDRRKRQIEFVVF